MNNNDGKEYFTNNCTKVIDSKNNMKSINILFVIKYCLTKKNELCNTFSHHYYLPPDT